MKVLFLGPLDSPTAAFLESAGEQVIARSDRLTTDEIADGEFDFLVSHGYRHIIRQPILDLFPRRAINLHISLLPWNRGADPNLWSWIDNTPKGVTIHFIDAGVDTGDVIAQREVTFHPHETLASSYAKLQQQIVDLFSKTWPNVRTGQFKSLPQSESGTSHRMKEKEEIAHLLSEGWDTPVHKLIAYGEKLRSVSAR